MYHMREIGLACMFYSDNNHGSENAFVTITIDRYGRFSFPMIELEMVVVYCQIIVLTLLWY